MKYPVCFPDSLVLTNGQMVKVEVDIKGDMTKKQFTDAVVNATEDSNDSTAKTLLRSKKLSSIEFTTNHKGCLIPVLMCTDSETLNEILETEKNKPKTKWKYDGTFDDLIKDKTSEISVSFKR